MCLLLLGMMIASLSHSPSQRVYFQDGQFLVNVRFGQWHDLREFITPDDPAVLEVYSQVGRDAWQLFDLVCRDISYRHDIGEFWQLARETLARQEGDCEDTSILLTSLLKVGGIPIYTVLGSYQGLGHAWCDHMGQIMETTFTRARPVLDPEHYLAYCLFSDQEVVELWPGALGELFELRRDEAMKLGLMAKALEAVA